MTSPVEPPPEAEPQTEPLGRALTVLVLVSLGGALVVTVARLSASDRWLPTMLTVLTPAALLPYAVALLATAYAVRRGRGAPTLVRPVAALATLGALLHLAWVVPMLVADDPPAGEGGTTVRVMTVNVKKGQADADDLRRTLDRVDPDILVLNEVEPPLRQQVDDLVPDGLERVAGEGFRVDTQIFARYASPGAEELGLSLAGWRTRLEIGGQTVETFGVHPFNPLLRPNAWRRDHELLRASAQANGETALIVGDLNATTDHIPLRRLAGDGFTDAVDAAGGGWQPTFPAQGRVPPVLAIDHVLVRGAWEVVATRTHRVAGSDHLGVSADLVLRD